MISTQMNVQGDLYDDLKEGNITVALHGGLGVDTHLTIDTKQLKKQHNSERGNVCGSMGFYFLPLV